MALARTTALQKLTRYFHCIRLVCMRGRWAQWYRNLGAGFPGPVPGSAGSDRGAPQQPRARVPHQPLRQVPGASEGGAPGSEPVGTTCGRAVEQGAGCATEGSAPGSGGLCESALDMASSSRPEGGRFLGWVQPPAGTRRARTSEARAAAGSWQPGQERRQALGPADED